MVDRNGYPEQVSSAARHLLLACPACGGRFADATFCPRDGARLEAVAGDDEYVGLIVSGDIELRSLAGAGAMGRVYRAHQRSIERDVAVKILHRELSGNAQLVRRFHREAKIASKLRHPHVVDMHMVGELPDGSLYIVMEYLDGSSLAETLSRAGGALALSRAIGIALQVAGAVGEGHALGIVHRDLKPENVMLVSRGAIDDWVKVLDFGIARLEIGDQSMETAAGGVLGTARYISPEGAAGAAVGPPGDVYALATMLYQMLAGRTPFDAVAPLGLLVKHVHEAPPPLHAYAPGVPDAIHKVVMDNLAKDPAARAPNGRAFAGQLSAAVSSPGLAEGPRTVRSQVPSTRVSEHGPTLYDSKPPQLRSEHLLPVVSAAMPSPHGEPVSIAAAARSEPQPPSVSAPRSRTMAYVLVAFVLGALISALVAWRSSNAREERDAYVTRVRHALAEGHYVAPPGENVEELVQHGLLRWKEDGELASLRSQAEHEMVTMAMAALSAGDPVGARDLADAASRLDPTDNSLRMIRAQAADALTGSAPTAGAPRVIFESPAVAVRGTPVTMRAHVVAGSLGAGAAIGELVVTVVPNGEAGPSVPLQTTFVDPTHVRVELVAPAEGSWDVTFEATVGGARVRAMRDLDVTAP